MSLAVLLSPILIDIYGSSGCGTGICSIGDALHQNRQAKVCGLLRIDFKTRPGFAEPGFDIENGYLMERTRNLGGFSVNQFPRPLKWSVR
jgi:hypothetical protein